MSSHFLHSWAVILILAVLTAVGDYCLKIASNQEKLFGIWLLAGCIVFGSTAIGWAWVMRYQKLATLGVAYSINTILLTAMVGRVFFNEVLNGYEISGILLALSSIVLLARFAG